MRLGKDIKLAMLKFWDATQPFKTYQSFPHKLRSFPLPQARALPDPLPKVAILTPCKNASACLQQYFEIVDAFDYPRERLHLRLLEGDSADDTNAVAARLINARRGGYASADLITLNVGFDAGDGRRSRAEIQRGRRSAIAMCRNRLLAAALETPAEYFLFVDVDMVAIAPETLKNALAFRAPILVANCLLEGTEAVFDLNSFRYTRPVSDRSAHRYVKGGIYQPPKGFFRQYSDFRQGNQIEPLHSVGGTFLLIRRDVAEAGADFPEEPYHLHIETEGFALKAAELGFGSFSAPQLFVYHGWET